MLKKLILAAAALGLAAPAFADNGWHHGRHKHWRQHARPVVVMPPPRIVYYAPAPAVVYAPPAPVYAPAPVYYAPPPVVYPAPEPSMSIRLRIPL